MEPLMFVGASHRLNCRLVRNRKSLTEQALRLLSPKIAQATVGDTRQASPKNGMLRLS
jgi:hypothetical protein